MLNEVVDAILADLRLKNWSLIPEEIENYFWSIIQNRQLEILKEKQNAKTSS